MAEERRISPALVVIPVGLAGLGILALAAMAFAAPPIVYRCPYCGTEFSTEAELLAHIESEHPQAPVFICPYCGATFATEEELLIHIELEHPQIPPEAWLLPTGHNDPDNQWDYEANAFDDDTDTYAENWTATGRWSGFIEFTIPPTEISAIRHWATSPLSPQHCDVDVYSPADGAWHHVYEDGFRARWTEVEIPGGAKLISKARMRFFNNSYTRRMRFRLHEFHFRGS